MDTSETYIKMCEKADEIQGRRIRYGDYLTTLKANILFTMGPHEIVGDYLAPDIWADKVPIDNPYYIWLPRQDQLQEMLPKEYTTVDAMLGHLLSWLREEDSYLEDQFAGNESMEQLLLCFVMKENHNKTWNGEAFVVTAD